MHKKLRNFLLYTLTVEFTCLVYYFVLPTDIENQSFAGFSATRWLIFLFLFLCMAISGFMLYSLFHSNRFGSFTIKLINRNVFSAFSFLVTILVLCGSLLLLFSPLRYHAYKPRLLPLLIYSAFLFMGYEGYDWVENKRNPWKNFWATCRLGWNKFLDILLWAGNFIDKGMNGRYFWILPMIFSLPILFTIAIRYDYPSGYSGLYTFIGEIIAENGFRMPQSIPYYGPGGMPFVYPPLTFYVMAFFLKVFHLPTFIYLRFAPPIFLLISIIPFSLLTQRLTGSKTAGVFASLVMIGSNLVFWPEATSGGIVRGLALMFAYWGMLYFLKAIEEEDKRSAILAAVFYACVALSHLIMLGMAVFFALAVMLNHIKIRKILFGFAISVGAILLVSPWVLYVINQFGPEVFVNASQSHDNLYFIFLIKDMSRFVPSMMQAFSTIFGMKYFWGLLVFGFFYLITRNRIAPLWFLIMLFFYHLYEQFFVISGAVMVGLVIALIYQAIRGEGTEKPTAYKAFVFWVLSVIYLVGVGCQAIFPENKPVITKYSMQVADFIKQETPKDSQYLLVTSPNEAEWFPYLLERVPMIGSWGGEWLGNYHENLHWVMDISGCDANQSLACINEMIIDYGSAPDILITKANREELTAQIEENTAMKMLYSNKEYIVWSYVE